MSTFMANKGNIVRKWYVVDAAGKPLGHTAVIVADLLRGKRKPTYTPHADCGDNVIVINADSLKRLHVYAGDTHEHQAQKPELWTAE